MSEVATRIHLDSNGQDLAIETIQDCEPILEWNKWARSEQQHSDWGRHVARIPNVKLVELLNEQHAKGNTTLRLFSPEFDALVQEKLYNGDWAYLRTDRPALRAGWSAGLL
jgi:hypothetical protein